MGKEIYYGRANFRMVFHYTWDALIGNHFDFKLRRETRKGLQDILLFPLLSRYLLYLVFASKKKFSNKFINKFLFPVFLLGKLVCLVIGLTLQVL